MYIYIYIYILDYYKIIRLLDYYNIIIIDYYNFRYNFVTWHLFNIDTGY